MGNLGRLERVDLRSIWTSESSDFTPWLARAENLSVLAETIGMELELEAQEKNVGPFRADILCRDLESESWVLVENQLERTDHTHLGQLLTYAAGLQTVTIVWVAAQFNEEHRAALDWLNEITDNRFRFFGLEVELWRIGSSPPAPRFNIISKPNNWTQSISRAARQIDEQPVSETKALQLKYWQALVAYINRNASSIRTRTPRPQHWTTFSIGRSRFHLAATVNTLDSRIAAELFMRGENAKIAYAQLLAQKPEIERDMGEPLSWEGLPDKIGCRIALYKDDTNPTDVKDWPNQHAWLTDALLRLDNALRLRVRALDLEQPEEDSDGEADDV